MEKSVYSCKEVSIPYADLVSLRQEGKLNLGIENAAAIQISSTPGWGPKTASSAAYHFWNWVAVAGFGYTVYLSFTSHWWWFIVGFLGAGFLFNTNKKANAENVLDSAFVDPEFYERIRSIDGWIYQIDEGSAARFKIG